MVDPTPNPLPTVDTVASGVDQTVGIVVQATKVPVEAAIIAAVPWMGFPVLMQAWEWVLGIVFDDIGNFLGTYAGYVVMDVQKYVNLNNAATALVALEAAQASGDANAITEAQSLATSAVAPVLHYVGQLKP